LILKATIQSALTRIKKRLTGLIASKIDTRSGSVGERGERIAEQHLKRSGYRILFRSYRTSLGEIDLVVLSKTRTGAKQIVFVEVKAWTNPGEGGPSDAVDDRKQERLTRLALEFLKKHRLLDCPARFDVVEVVLNPLSVRHFENAFEATGKYQWFS
jgi:putative endonuclease